MFWEILWALILGFALSGAVQAVVSKSEMRRLLPDDSPRSLGIACGLGAASSSCSYAAVALRALALPPWRGLHRRDGLRVRVGEPRDRARHPDGARPRLAVHARRVRRRTADDRPGRPRVPTLPPARARRGGARAGRAGHARPHGGPR